MINILLLENTYFIINNINSVIKNNKKHKNFKINKVYRDI